MRCPPEAAAAITSKQSKYAQYLDLREWDKFLKEVVLPDCRWKIMDRHGTTLTLGKNTFAWDSAADYMTYFPKALERMDSMHMFGPGDFELVSEDTVKAVFPLEDQLVSKDLGTWAETRGGGFCYETWKLKDGEWFLQEMFVKRVYQKNSALINFFVFLTERFGIQMM